MKEAMRFRMLGPAEEAEFRKWARDNYDPQRQVDELWHPAVRDEWRIISDELREKAKVEVYKVLKSSLSMALELGVFYDLKTCVPEACIDTDTIISLEAGLDQLGNWKPYSEG